MIYIICIRFIILLTDEIEDGTKVGDCQGYQQLEGYDTATQHDPLPVQS